MPLGRRQDKDTDTNPQRRSEQNQPSRAFRKDHKSFANCQKGTNQAYAFRTTICAYRSISAGYVLGSDRAEAHLQDRRSGWMVSRCRPSIRLDERSEWNYVSLVSISAQADGEPTVAGQLDCLMTFAVHSGLGRWGEICILFAFRGVLHSTHQLYNKGTS